MGSILTFKSVNHSVSFIYGVREWCNSFLNGGKTKIR